MSIDQALTGLLVLCSAGGICVTVLLDGRKTRIALERRITTIETRLEDHLVLTHAAGPIVRRARTAP